MALVIDSHLRCVHCSKLMVMDIGPDLDGRCEIVHSCWNCGYEEMDVQWRDKRVTVLADYRERKTAAQRLYEMRSGA